jgi:hypothetical protein
MDNNKIITFFLYIAIVTILTSILYKMYNNFLTENFFNVKKFNLKEKFTDSDIDQKLKYINLISNTVEKYDSKQHYIVKDNPTIPICNNNDILNNSNCIISSTVFYVQDGSYFDIQVQQDGLACSIFSDPIDNFNINNCTYNFDLSRNTKFIFPNSIIRQFDYNNILDKSIINYFNNYTKYNNYLSGINDQVLTSTDNDINLINKYTLILEKLLQLSNSSNDNIFGYNSGYSYDINTIKTNIINLYNNLLSVDKSNLKYIMNIEDKTKIRFLTDSSKNVYSFELHPDVTITFKNLLLGFDNNSIIENGIIDQTSIWNLNYLNLLTPTNSSTPIVYKYKPKPYYYPIVIPFTISKNSNLLTYFNNLFKSNPHGIINMANINLLDSTNASSNLNTVNTNFMNNIDDLSTITDIFAMYDSKSNIFSSFIINHSNIPIINFFPLYLPYKCDNKVLYNNNCYSLCPPEYPFDINTACLIDDESKYINNSDLCNYLLNNLPINPTNEIQRLIDMCSLNAPSM